MGFMITTSTLHKRDCRTLEEELAFALYLHYVEFGDVQQTAQEHDIKEDKEKEEEEFNEEKAKIQDEG